MNPKANFQNGWTVKMKQTRKPKQPTAPKDKGKKAKNTGKKERLILPEAKKSR